MRRKASCLVAIMRNPQNELFIFLRNYQSIRAKCNNYI